LGDTNGLKFWEFQRTHLDHIQKAGKKMLKVPHEFCSALHGTRKICSKILRFFARKAQKFARFARYVAISYSFAPFFRICAGQCTSLIVSSFGENWI
jgi:Zn-dependent M32 family carboxypeptidase